MVYIFLNAIIGGFLIWFSYYIDRKTGEQDRNPLVTMNLLLAILFSFVAKAVMMLVGWSWLSTGFGNGIWMMILSLRTSCAFLSR